MAVIDLAQSFSTITEPVIQERTPAERHEFTNLIEALNSFICSRNIPVFAPAKILKSKEFTDMRTGEVMKLPEVASYQIRKGFLCLNSNGSIYQKNHGKSHTIGYIRLNENNQPEFYVKNPELLGSIV